MDSKLLMAFNRLHKYAAYTICYLLDHDTATGTEIADSAGYDVSNFHKQQKFLVKIGVMVYVEIGYRKGFYILKDKWKEALIEWNANTNTECDSVDSHQDVNQ